MINNRKLYAIYDLLHFAPTWDLVSFLTCARIHAQIEGYNEIELIVVKRPIAERFVMQPQEKASYDHRIFDILTSILPMFPIRNFKFVNQGVSEKEVGPDVFPLEYFKEFHNYKLIRRCLTSLLKLRYSQGGIVPSIKIPLIPYEKVKRSINAIGKRVGTVTLRQARHISSKNSNTDSWRVVVEQMRREGLYPVVVPDVENSEDLTQINPLGLAAMLNPSYRAALYDLAAINLSVSNGAVIFQIFNNNCRFHMHKLGSEGTNSTEQRHIDDFGARPNPGRWWSNLPWHSISYEQDDNPERILEGMREALSYEGGGEGAPDISKYPMLLDPNGRLDGDLVGVRELLNSQKYSESDLENLQHRVYTALASETDFYSSSKSLTVRGFEALKKNLYADAISYFKQAVLLEERFQDPYLGIAYAYNSTNEKELATKWLSNGLVANTSLGLITHSS